MVTDRVGRSIAGSSKFSRTTCPLAGITTLESTGASISRYVAIGSAFVLMGMGFVGLAGTRRRRL